MKAKTLILFLWLLLPQVLMAQVNAVVVNMTNGAKTVFLLVDTPVITYSESNLIVRTANKEVSVPVTDIVNVTLEERSALTKIESAFTADGVLFRQLPADTDVRVYTIDGKAVCTQKVDSDGSAGLDLSRLPKGVLIIKTPETTIKVNNR